MDYLQFTKFRGGFEQDFMKFTLYDYYIAFPQPNVLHIQPKPQISPKTIQKSNLNLLIHSLSVSHSKASNFKP